MGARSRSQLSKGLAIGLQQFSDALSRALERKEDRKERDEQRKAMAAEREESRKLRERDFEASEAHRRETESVQRGNLDLRERELQAREGGKSGGSSDDWLAKFTDAPTKLQARRIKSHLEKGVQDPAEMFRIDSQGRPLSKKVSELPRVLRDAKFKDRKGDESVDVTMDDIEEARALVAQAPELYGGSSTQRTLDHLGKGVASDAERHGWSPGSYEDLLDEVRGVHERQTKTKAEAAPRTDSGIGESGEGEPQQPWGGMPEGAPQAAPVPDSKDGRTADYISELMARRLSRDPQSAMMAGHELRKLGYPAPVSPFDMIDPQTGMPSPELLQAAQTDPELGSMLEQYTQMQQQQMGAQPGAQPMQQGGGMQPPAQTQQSGPGPEPVRGMPPRGGNPRLFQGTKRPKTPGDVDKSFEAGQLGSRYPKGTTVRRR